MSEAPVQDVGDDDLVAQIRDMVMVDGTESEGSYATEPIQVAMPLMAHTAEKLDIGLLGLFKNAMGGHQRPKHGRKLACRV